MPQEVQKAESAVIAAPHLEQNTLGALRWVQLFSGLSCIAGRIQQEIGLFAAFFYELAEMPLRFGISFFGGGRQQNFSLIATLRDALTCTVELCE